MAKIITTSGSEYIPVLPPSLGVGVTSSASLPAVASQNPENTKHKKLEQD
jgi:hypothetical protein